MTRHETTTNKPLELSEEQKELLINIGEVEVNLMMHNKLLLDLKHKYLNSLGFDIESIDSFTQTFKYEYKNEIFLDVDQAMEFVAETTTY